MISSLKVSKADFIGIVSSSICLVHCLAAPLLIACGAGFITNPIFKYLFVVISFVSIFKATENVNNKKIAWLLWVSFCGLLFSTLFHERYEWLHYSGDFFAILIIVAHILNIKNCQKCSK